MSEYLAILEYISGIETWTGLAGLVILVFLILFKTIIIDLVKNLPVPPKYAAIIPVTAMVLVALVTLATLGMAVVSASDERQEKLDEQKKYEEALVKWKNGIRTCIEKQVPLTSNFTHPGVARCPGGGCFLQSGSCNKKDATVEYVAPGGYFIESYNLETLGMNHGNVGGLISSQDNQGRTTKISAHIWCDPPDYLGAPGGWARVKIRGTIRHRDENTQHQRNKEICQTKFPEPRAPED